MRSLTMRSLIGSVRAVRSLSGFVRWYLSEITGSAEYDRYVARSRLRQAAHPRQPLLSRREYERRRADLHQETPGSRCC